MCEQHVAELSDLTEGSGKDLMDAKHCTAQTFMFKSYRCFYLSESYTIMKKCAEGIGLLGRAEEHAVQAMELYREWGKAEAEVGNQWGVYAGARKGMRDGN